MHTMDYYEAADTQKVGSTHCNGVYCYVKKASMIVCIIYYNLSNEWGYTHVHMYINICSVFT